MTLDTLKYAKQLKHVGVSEEQSEVHAEALIDGVFIPIQTRFDQVDERLVRVNDQFTRVDLDFRQVDNRLTYVEDDLGKLMGLVYVVIIGLIVLLVHAFWPF